MCDLLLMGSAEKIVELYIFSETGKYNFLKIKLACVIVYVNILNKCNRILFYFHIINNFTIRIFIFL